VARVVAAVVVVGNGGGNGGGNNNRPAPPKDGPGPIADALHNAEALKLTPEQKTKLEALGKEIRAKAEKGGDREAIRKEAMDGVKEILTPEQLAKLKESMNHTVASALKTAAPAVKAAAASPGGLQAPDAV